jgi:hypothetical protein
MFCRTLAAIIVSVAFLWPAHAEVQKKPSTEAQAKITDKLQQSSDNKLIVFNHAGTVEDNFNLDQKTVDRYGSLKELLNSNKNPVSSCKNPTPTPPPGCVICDNGWIICSAAYQVQRKRSKSMLDSSKPEQPQ